MFINCVNQSPNAVAIVQNGQALSYKELYSQATRIAHGLQTYNYPVDTIIPILGNRSAETIVAIWGVILAGYAYCPLDPQWPSIRIKTILKDIGTTLVLNTTTSPVDLNNITDNLEGIFVKSGDEILQMSLSSAWQIKTVNPEQLVYTIYTSGSTGLPKGVLIEHRNLIALLDGFEKIAPKPPILKTTSIAPLYFDVSVWEIFTTLCYGGTLYIVDSIENLAETIIKENITNAYIPPSIVAPLIDVLLMGSDNLSLERLLVGVEPIMQKTLQKYLDAIPNIRIINGYGPTETTICATLHVFQRSIDPNNRVPIGNAIDGYHVLLVDNNDNPITETGVTGELLIGGAGLCRGYLNRPNISSKFFTQVTFNNQQYTMYRTGDLAHYLLSGSLEFVGRKDDQIKFRGVRIEPHEIEIVVHQIIDVKRCFVHKLLVNQVARLVLFVESENESKQDLLKMLQSNLPHYMVPTDIFIMQKFAETANGKIDYDSIYHMFHESILFTPTEYADNVEAIITQIWEENLGNLASKDANFYELGGTSAIAFKMAAKLCSVFKIEMKLNVIFQHSTITDLTNKVKGILSNQSSSLSHTSQQDTDIWKYDASAEQKRFWIMQQFHPEDPSYNETILIQFDGEVDIKKLGESLYQSIERHEAFRTNFIEEQTTLLAIITENTDLHFDVLHITNESEALESASKFAGQVFDLASDSLIRVQLLLSKSTRQSFLVVVVHHSIFDEKSFKIFIEDIIGSYKSQMFNEQYAPVQSTGYAVYARRQNDPKYLSKIQEKQHFWMEYVPKVLIAHPLELSAHIIRSPNITSIGDLNKLPLPEDLYMTVQSYCQQKRVTPYVLFFSIFSLLLYRYTMKKDQLLGTIVSNRDSLEFENTIGAFVNALPIVLQLEQSMTFDQLIQHVQENLLMILEHKDVQFDEIVRILKPIRGTAYHPLTSLFFVWHEMFPQIDSYPGLKIDIQTIHNHTSKFDLTCHISDHHNHYEIEIEYRSELFASTWIDNMLQHYAVLLKNALYQSQATIVDLPLLTSDDLAFIRSKSTGELNYPYSSIDQSLISIFEENSIRFASQPAIQADEGQINYSELNKIANKFARYLMEQKIQKGDYICLVFERSVDMIIAILAAMKIGAIYVPIDPLTPPTRIKFIIEDTGSKWILTHKLFDFEDSFQGCKIINLNHVNLTLYASTNLHNKIEKNSPVYVIYTSGSTGYPKGVIVTNQNILRLLLTTKPLFKFSHKDTWVFFHSYAFDFSVWELWGAIFYGGRIVLVSYEDSRSPEKFYEIVVNQEITVLNQTPSAFIEFMEVDQQYGTGALKLRYIIFGGEALNFNMLKGWVNRHGFNSPELINMYGITETTVHTTFKRITPETMNTPSQSNIGTPLPDLGILLLDEYLNPVPIGVPGEIYVTGPGVSAGYHNRATLTQEKFLTNFPVTNISTEYSVYRSGDIAYWNSQGDLIYVGRNDRQAKLRGFRIELGEIEEQARALPQVQNCVALLLTFNDNSSDEIVLYVVPRNETVFSRDSINQYLHIFLPYYMVPRYIVEIRDIPLTINGKLNVKALPLPDHDTDPGDLIAASTRIQKQLTMLWKQILNVDQIGIDENFFDLGGDSFKLTKLNSLIQHELNIKLSIVELYQYPTIRQLETLLKNKAKSENLSDKQLIKKLSNRHMLKSKRKNKRK